MSSAEPLGRDAELQLLDRLLERMRSGLQGAVITGPAGIGKTTVWREGWRRAEASGHLVLIARPAQAETSLSYAGLSDLLRGIDPAFLGALPTAQREAIEHALLRGDSGPVPGGGRAIATAFMSLLQAMSQERPVVVAVDDAQWLDEETSRAIGFALRRLESVPVGLLASLLTDGEEGLALAGELPVDRRTEIRLEPLSAAALHAIVKQQLDVVFPRPTLVRIVIASGGNPFYAVEIARELKRIGVPPPGHPLPLPTELRLLVRSRLARLPSRTRDVLLLAACMSQPTVRDVGHAALAAVDDLGIVDVDRDGRVRFTHPLLASAIYESATRSRRRAIHLQLADRAPDREERARHLALATAGPDETVADALEQAALDASQRGAPTAAAELARRALDLTPNPGDAGFARRALAVARYLLDSSGDPAEARGVLERALAGVTDAEARAELLLFLGSVSRNEGDLVRGYDHLLEALALTHDPRLAARIHVDAAWLAEADPPLAIGHCDSAMALITERDVPMLFSTALLHRAYLRLVSGLGPDDEAVAQGEAIQDVQDLRDTSPVPALWPAFRDDFELARRRHDARLAWSRLVGDEPTRVSMLCHLAELDVWTGHLSHAASLAREAEGVVERSGSNLFLATVLYASGLVAAHTGQIEQAATCGESILHLTTFASSGFREVRGHSLLGFVALSTQDLASADLHFTCAASILDRIGEVEPVRFRFHADHAESVIGIGDLDRAAALVGRLEARAEVFPRPWLLAVTARSRGLLLAARGELDGSLAALREALSFHERLDMPFERARSLLVYGRVLKRCNDRREARVVLQEAAAIFESLGTLLWAEQARTQLSRLPIRRASTDLTPTEERIAALAASGMTNREVAERAFVSPKTVEANLARVYEKLGLHSRAELGRVMAERAAALKT